MGPPGDRRMPSPSSLVPRPAYLLPPSVHDSSSSSSVGRESLAVLSCLPERIESVSSSADLNEGTWNTNTAPSASPTGPREADGVLKDVVRPAARIQARDTTLSGGARITAPAAPGDVDVEFSESGLTSDDEGWKEVRNDVVYSLYLGATSVERGDKGSGTAAFPTLHAWSSSANPCQRTATTSTGSCMPSGQEPDARLESDHGAVRERENDCVSPLPEAKCHWHVIAIELSPG